MSIDKPESPVSKQAVKKDSQDWISSFDRDLIKAARDRLLVDFEMDDDDRPIRNAVIVQVDRNFIKVVKDGEDDPVWLNRVHVSKVWISSEHAE